MSPMKNVRSLKDLDVKGKKVLMRVDFNVPLDEQGRITDDTRIQASLPSINHVLKNGGSLILMSHLGKPKGKPSKEFSLKPCGKRLSELLKLEVQMAPDCVGSETKKLANQLKPGQVLLLENLRFHDAEEKPEKDPAFAKQLAELGDVYVNDAFGTAHRAHSSTATIAKFFPGNVAAGFLMEKEIQFLGDKILHPQHPFHAIIGGAKISTKIGVLKSLVKQVDALYIGGGMAYTFMKAQGIPIGDSIHEDDFLQASLDILKACKERGIPCYLPQDIVIADNFSNEASTKTIEAKQGIPSGFQGMDIGSKTSSEYVQSLSKAKTILWNGPLGVFEFDKFAKGTEAIAKAVAGLDAITVVGGGDSIAALNKLKLADKMSHLSTGGGASLEFIEFGTLPGIEALKT